VGSGRVPTWIGLGAVLAVLAAAPAVLAQPISRVAALDEPFAGAASLPNDGKQTPGSPVPPRTSYQQGAEPRRDPNGIPYEPDFTLPDGSIIPVPQAKSRRGRIGSRYGTPTNIDSVPQPNGGRRSLLTGGWVVNIESADGKESTEFAADDMVIWSRGLAVDNPKGFTTEEGKSEYEIYMTGNVIIRTVRGQGRGRVEQTLRAQEVYYDAQANKAIALRAALETTVPLAKDPLRISGEEVRRLDLENWEALNSTGDASKLPSDPGLRYDSRRFTLSERRTIRTNIFGLPIRTLGTWEPVEYTEQLVTGENVVTRLAGIPVFYIPRLRTDASDPLGPLQAFSFSQNRIFGTQFFTTWDLYELLGLKAPANHKWRLDLDYLSKRGPAVGSLYTYRIPGDTPADPPLGYGLFKAYGIQENLRQDILGGTRGFEPVTPDYRGRILFRHQQEVDSEFYFQGQLAWLSDVNFFEQYYKNEFDIGPNQETFAYLTWQRRNFGANVLAEDRNRQWVSETNWLPKVDGYLIGQTFLDDLFVYSARGGVAYAQAEPTKYNPYPILSTDKRVDTGRFDLWQELSVPFALGPVKVAPFGDLQLTEYTTDLNGNEIGRVYGAGGARASVPFSHLYADVASELMNVRGLYHKVVFGANYRYATTNVPYTQLPLLDRLNDDSTDQAFRNIVPFQAMNVPGPNGTALMNAASNVSVFNPQRYAIRRVVEGPTETLDTLQVLQMDVRQRLQTKRGYPGLEHTVDFITLDVSASYFPSSQRDNFGHQFSFLEYFGLWNVGDRTALTSSGWFEPYSGGSKYWNAGMYLNRTDRTNFYIGYRQTDPLNSKAVTTSLSYQLSRRYYASLGASYDFGLGQALSNSFTITRTGSDLTVTLGFTYTAFVNSFGFQFMVVPNLAYGRFGSMGQSSSMGRR
jgi:hypothetical protein